MTPVKMLGDQATFVGLQRANKVPLQRGDTFFPKVKDLFHPFLNIIFAKCPLSGCDRFFDGARRFGFADGKQRNFF